MVAYIAAASVQLGHEASCAKAVKHGKGSTSVLHHAEIFKHLAFFGDAIHHFSTNSACEKEGHFVLA